MSEPGLGAALEASPLGEALRQSVILYPAINLMHLLGLVLLVGPILLLDLRLLGAATTLPLREVSRYLTAFALLGLSLLFASGSFLFAADAGALISNPVLMIKLGLITLGLTNAVLFRSLWSPRFAHWDEAPPLGGRIQAALSILLWFSVASAGRLIAYR